MSSSKKNDTGQREGTMAKKEFHVTSKDGEGALQ